MSNSIRFIAVSVIAGTALLLASCGGGSSGSSSNNASIRLATTTTCDNISGASALHWDFSTGTLRTDYPVESKLPPVPIGGSFLHPRLSLSFFYPAGWSTTALIDAMTFPPSNEPSLLINGNLTVLAGVSVVRNDGRALWRFLHTTEGGNLTAQQRLNQAIDRVLTGFGIIDQPVEVCSLLRPGFVGGFTGQTSAAYLRSNEFTIQVVTTLAQVPLFGQPNSIVTLTTVAPNAELNREILGTFLPIGWQLITRGSGSTQCSDELDNDGDGLVDLNDPQCSNASDDSEAQ